jgi:hypothetical protein
VALVAADCCPGSLNSADGPGAALSEEPLSVCAAAAEAASSAAALTPVSTTSRHFKRRVIAIPLPIAQRLREASAGRAIYFVLVSRQLRHCQTEKKRNMAFGL